MSLLGLITLATIFYTLFDVFASRAGNAIDPTLSSIIFNGLGALIPLAIYLFYIFTKGTKFITTTTSGIVYSILAGIAIAFFAILLIKIFEKGGLAYVVALIYGGAIVLTALVGRMFYKESISGLQATGIFIIVVGIVLVVISKLGISMP